MKYEFKDRKMIHEGGEFNKFSPREVLQYAIGGLLYMPATRMKIVQDILEKKTKISNLFALIWKTLLVMTQ